MNVFYQSERSFHLYAFESGENYLLIRAHAYSQKNIKTIDLLFTHTSYIESVNFFEGIEIRKASPKEVSLLEDKLKSLQTELGEYFVLISRGKHYYIKAAFLSIYQNDLGLKKYYVGKHFGEGPEGKLLYENINQGAIEFRKEHPYLYPNRREAKQTSFASTEKFSLWGINLSHSYLTIKSSANESKAIYIDIIGLDYLELKPELKGIEIDSPSEKENQYIDLKCRVQDSDSLKNYLVSSNGERYLIRAAQLYATEYEASVFGYIALFKDEDFGELLFDSRSL